MARILITAGPTREYIDPVRYITNASSGRMGAALAAAALGRGHEPVIVSGPVHITYPAAARIVPVVSTQEMLEASAVEYETCDGLIAAAAPSDYRPHRVAARKMSKTGQPVQLQLIETPDIVATLAKDRRNGQWVVGFALETHDQFARAMAKLKKKHCDLLVLNDPRAIDAPTNQVDILEAGGQIVESLEGAKSVVAEGIFRVIQSRLIAQGS
ncbi:MAG: phosphopantothenoylcysteine decarboxylase [Planctomycetota bacterium]